MNLLFHGKQLSNTLYYLDSLGKFHLTWKISGSSRKLSRQKKRKKLNNFFSNIYFRQSGQVLFAMKRFPEIMENFPDNMTYSFMKNGFQTHVNILDCKNFLCSGKISRNSENFPYNTVLFFHKKTAFKHMLIFYFVWKNFL